MLYRSVSQFGRDKVKKFARGLILQNNIYFSAAYALFAHYKYRSGGWAGWLG